MRRILIIFLILFVTQANAQVVNSIDKTKAQLSQIISGSTVPSKSWFEDQIFQRLVELTTAHLQRGYSADDFATLAAAINRAETDTAMVIVSTNESITATDTLRRKAAMWVYKGGTISLASSTNLLIQGHFFAGNYKIFSGSGTVKFDEGSVDAVNPMWWGAIGDSATSAATNVTAFNTSMTSRVSGKRLRVVTPPGVYLVNSNILVPSNTEFIGNNATIINTDTTLANGIIRAGTAIGAVVPVQNIKIHGFTIKTVPTPTSLSDASRYSITAQEVDTLEITGNRILNSGGIGMVIISCRNVKIIRNHVENANRDGIHLSTGDNTDRGRTVYNENIIVQENTVKNCGDDKIACVSYRRPKHPSAPDFIAWTGAQLRARNISIVGNIVEGAKSASQSGRGITIMGAQNFTVIGNTVRGASNGQMLQGIDVNRVSTLDGFNSANGVIANNTIVDGQFDALEAENGGIKIGAADSIVVIGNTISWSDSANGILIRALAEDCDFMRAGSRSVQIIGNHIDGALTGIRIFTSDSCSQWNEDIMIANNDISNVARMWVNADSIRGIMIVGNRFQNCCQDSVNVSSLYGIRLSAVERDAIIRGNIFRTALNPDQYAIGVLLPDTSGTDSTCNLIEAENTFSNMTPGLGIFNTNTDRPFYFSSQGNSRVHYGTGAPTDGIWRKGDRVINRDPDKGEKREWINITAGTPGTWVNGLAEISGLNMGDTTTFTLSGNVVTGASGYSNIRINTQGGVALDTVTTMLGNLGQIITVRSKNNSRDVRFVDSNEFSGLRLERTLDDTLDALTLLRVPGGIWVEIGWNGNGSSSTDSFSGTAETDTVTITNGSASDRYFVQITGAAAPSANDFYRVEAISGGFVVHRSAAGTSGLTYIWRKE